MVYKTRLKRSSFVPEAKRFMRVFALDLTIATTPMSSADITDPIENDMSTVEVRLAIPQLYMCTQEVKIPKETMIDTDYPQNRGSIYIHRWVR